jgi:Ca2+-binding EF-hand superfamily protein
VNIKTIAASALTLALAASFAVPAFAQKEGKQRPSPDQRAERMIRLIDMNGDSRISRDEMTARLGDTIKTVDLNGDGQLSKAEIEGQRQQIRKANKAYRQAVRAGEIERGAYDAKIIRVNRLPKATIKRFDRIDANSDGNLDQAELTRVADFVFKRRDKDGDGFITKADLLARKK